MPVTLDEAERTLWFDDHGIDRVEFLLAANAGEPLRPLARVASGGETARLMLALKSILSEVDTTPTLVFDEVDVGVGGRSGQVVGEKLWGLTAGSSHHQVLCISHLAQIAAFADSHFKISKRQLDDRTISNVEQITEAERIEEIAAMLDGVPPTDESRANARAMLERVDGWKAEHQVAPTNGHAAVEPAPAADIPPARPASAREGGGACLSRRLSRRLCRAPPPTSGGICAPSCAMRRCSRAGIPSRS